MIDSVRADRLTVVRGERPIFSGLSFEALAGEALIVTGPNGAGKTTLLRAMAGLLPISAGSILLAQSGGEPDGGLSERCHFIGHAPAIKPRLTVQENADFWWRHLSDGKAGAPATDLAAALDAFGLSDLGHIPAAFLSAGQKRRLGLARLLLVHRPVWLLDEPTTSLDQASIARLERVIERHLAAGGIVIAATHQALSLSRQRHLELGPAEVLA